MAYIQKNTIRLTINGVTVETQGPVSIKENREAVEDGFDRRGYSLWRASDLAIEVDFNLLPHEAEALAVGLQERAVPKMNARELRDLVRCVVRDEIAADGESRIKRQLKRLIREVLNKERAAAIYDTLPACTCKGEPTADGHTIHAKSCEQAIAILAPLWGHQDARVYRSQEAETPLEVMPQSCGLCPRCQLMTPVDELAAHAGHCQPCFAEMPPPSWPLGMMDHSE